MNHPSTVSSMPSTDIPTEQRRIFEKIVEQNRDRVCAVAYCIVGDRAHSEEVAQEAFLTAWRKLPELEDTTKLPAWICGIARNLARNAHRKMLREVPTEHSDAERTAMSSPYENVSDAEAETLMWKTLDSLDHKYREPLVLYYRTDRSIKDVAVSLDISEVAAKQLLSRGRKKLAARVTAIIETALPATKPAVGFSAAVLSAFDALGVAHAQVPILKPAGASSHGVLEAAATTSVASLIVKLACVGGAAIAVALAASAMSGDDSSAGIMDRRALGEASAPFARPDVDGRTTIAKSGTPKASSTGENGIPGGEIDGPDDIGVGASALEGRPNLKRRVDMDFGEAEFINILELLADVTATNVFVIGDDYGAINLRLKNVPAIDVLDEALLLAGAVREEIAILRITATGSCAAQGFSKKPVTIDLEDSVPKDVFAALQASAPVPIVVDPDVSGPPMTLAFESVPFDGALAAATAQADLGCETDYAFEISPDVPDGTEKKRYHLNSPTVDCERDDSGKWNHAECADIDLE